MAERELIGKGLLGFVYKAQVGGDVIALREVRLPKKDVDPAAYPGVPELVAHVEALAKLEHKSLVQYLGVSTDGGLWIKQQYVGSCTPLPQCIASNGGKLPEMRLKRVGHQLLGALNYLHCNNVCHRYLKSSSVFVASDFAAYLSDFDICNQILDIANPSGPGCFTMAGLVYHVAPEAIVNNSEYSPKADIWSFGCVLMEMLCGKAPFADEANVMLAMKKIAAGDVPPVPEGTSANLADLVAKCFTLDPAQRPTAQQLQLHPFWY